jgi:hypothetical protein
MRTELRQNIMGWLVGRRNGSDASQLIVPIINAALMRGGTDLREGVNVSVTNGGSRINEAWSSIIEDDGYERMIRLLQNWVELEAGQPYSNRIRRAIARLRDEMQDDGSVEPAEHAILLHSIRSTGFRSSQLQLHNRVDVQIEAVLRRATDLAQAAAAEQLPVGTTEQLLRTWLATASPNTTYSLIYCPILHEAMQSEHSMEHRRVWPIILGVEYTVIVDMLREAFANMGDAARRRDDTTNPHIEDLEQERLIDLPARGAITQEVERMIREWQASRAADAARDAGRIVWRRNVPFFIPTAPNRMTWAQVANGATTASTGETMADEGAVDESRSTCQLAGCEFEGTREEVRIHEEHHDRRVDEETPAEENERISAEDAADLDELEREETIRNEIDTSIAESEHRTSTTEEYEQNRSNEAYARMYERCTSDPQGTCSGNECYECEYCWDMYAYVERRRLSDQREAVEAGMTERRERCPSRPLGTCSMDVRLNCGYCYIRDINNVNDLHAAIQIDDEATRSRGGQQSISNQIDSNSAIMAERRQRCLSIPPGHCTGTSREGCDYCRMRDIIATRNIQHVGADMSPAELQATIQQDAFELSNQIDRITENMLERRRRCTTTPPGACAGEHRDECDFCRITAIISAERENESRGLRGREAQLPPSEMLSVIQRDEYETLWRRNHASTREAMQAISLQGENQTTRRGTCEDCLQGGCCVGAAGGGPCTFVGTCNNCIRFRTCEGAANGGPCSGEDGTSPTQGHDASPQESTTRHERDETANTAQAQDAEAEARVAALVEDQAQGSETEHPTDPEMTTSENDQREATTTTEVVSEPTVIFFQPSPGDIINTAAAQASVRAYNARAGHAYAVAGYEYANQHADVGTDRAVSAAAWANIAARGAVADQRATRAAEAAIEASQAAAVMTEPPTDPTTAPMSAMERFREGLSAAATSGRAEQRRRASQGESNAGRWWEDLATATTGRAEQRRRACCSERVVCSESPGQSQMITSEDRLEPDEPTGLMTNPDAWPTIETSPENTTRRSRRPGAWGSQEPGTGSPDSGARGPESRARSRVTGTRSPEHEGNPESGVRNLESRARSRETGTRSPELGARTVMTTRSAAAAEVAAAAAAAAMAAEVEAAEEAATAAATTAATAAAVATAPPPPPPRVG